MMNDKTKPATVAGQRVLSYVERVEKLIEERQGINSDIRDVFTEAKGNGYDVKTLRKLVQIRSIDAAERDEANALLDTYAGSIGMEVGTFAREPSEDELVERAARVIREVDLCATHLVGIDRKPPKIEAIKDLIGCSTGKAHKLRGLVIERLEGFSPSNDATVKIENENGETAVRSDQPAKDSRNDRQPDGPVSVLGNPIEESRGGEGSALIFSVTGSSGTPPKPEGERRPARPIEDAPPASGRPNGLGGAGGSVAIEHAPATLAPTAGIGSQHPLDDLEIPDFLKRARA